MGAARESQMICVIETESASSLLELVRGQAFERGLRRDRHEDWQLYWTMWQRQDGRARLCDGASRGKIVLER